MLYFTVQCALIERHIQLNGVNPYYYLRYVLERVPAIPLFARDGSSFLEELMPWSSQLQDAVRSYEKEKEKE